MSNLEIPDRAWSVFYGNVGLSHRTAMIEATRIVMAAELRRIVSKTDLCWTDQQFLLKRADNLDPEGAET